MSYFYDDVEYNDLPEEEKEAIWDMMFTNMSDDEIEDHLEGLI